MRIFRLLTALTLCLALGACFGRGTGQEIVQIDGRDITVFTYRPGDCENPGLLFVFHGNSRNADDYRDHAKRFADETCLLVFAPLFDRERFPNWRYHRGGIATEDGAVLPPEDWTVPMIGKLVDWARERENRPDAAVYLFGHSAGGQFLSRVAAFTEIPGVVRIVTANASSYVMPGPNEAAPYGLGGLPAGAGEEYLAAYLRQPLTIYLGAEDTGREDVHNAPPAQRQGETRLARGQSVYRTALAAAISHNLTCNWKLTVALDVGHSARHMLNAPETPLAFGLPLAAARR